MERIQPVGGKTVILKRGEKVVANPRWQGRLKLNRAVVVDHQSVTFLVEKRQCETRGEFLGWVGDHEALDVVTINRMAVAGVSKDPVIAVIGSLLVAEGGLAVDENQTHQEIAVGERKGFSGGLVDSTLVIRKEEDDVVGGLGEELLTIGKTSGVALSERALVDS